MYTLEYTDPRVGDLIHRWNDDEYTQALLVAQYVARQKSTHNVKFKQDGYYKLIWPTY